MDNCLYRLHLNFSNWLIVASIGALTNDPQRHAGHVINLPSPREEDRMDPDPLPVLPRQLGHSAEKCEARYSTWIQNELYHG